MAIESFGESLLSKQRKRQEKQRRKEERSAALQLAGTVGIGLYRQNLLKKQQNFFNGQEARNLRIAYAQGQSISDLTNKEDDRIFASGKGTGDYYLDQEFEKNKQILLTQYSEDIKKRNQIEAGLYNAAIYELSKEQARERTARHEERRRFTREFKTAGTVEDALKLAYKGPKTALEGVFQKFSKTDLDEENLKGLKSTQLGSLLLPPNAEQQSRAAQIEDNYRKYNNMQTATKLTELDEIPENIVENSEIKFAGGKAIEVITRTDLNTNQSSQSYNVLEDDILTDSKKAEMLVVDRSMRQFNPLSATAQRLSLNTEGQKEFRKQVREVTDGSIDTEEEYKKIIKIYYDLGGQEKYATGNEKADIVRQELGQLLLRSAAFSDITIDQMEILIDPQNTYSAEDRNEAYRQLGSNINSIINGIPNLKLTLSDD